MTIAMNGVTGRMGRNQHLERSIAAIRADGGVPLPDGDVLMPDPILVGRNPDRLKDLCAEYGVTRWSTDLDEVLADPSVDIYFDAQLTSLRAPAVRAAITAGKAVYCEKPLSDDLATSLELAEFANERGVPNGIVHDKLFLPGLVKLRRLIDSDFFGRILSVRIDFGYWVFEGHHEPSQRPSWNSRREDGGSIILDMYPHWQYVIEDLFGPIRSVVTVGATHITSRVDEQGQEFTPTADDAAYGILELDGGVIVQVHSSWTTRVHRGELVEFHVDGTNGSAVAGLRDCVQQHRSATPRPVWNPDLPNPIDFRAGWLPVPEVDVAVNGFRAQWERFLRHVAIGEPFPWSLAAGARGSLLVEAAMRSWDERRWVDLGDVIA
jgi:predicted dehydrogenase